MFLKILSFPKYHWRLSQYTVANWQIVRVATPKKKSSGKSYKICCETQSNRELGQTLTIDSHLTDPVMRVSEMGAWYEVSLQNPTKTPSGLDLNAELLEPSCRLKHQQSKII